MAQTKYAEMDKDTLVAAIKARRAGGRKIAVDLRANEDNLRAALDTDDVENGDFTGPVDIKPATPPPKPSKKVDETEAPGGATELTREQLRLGAIARADGVTSREVPEDLHEYKGEYSYRGPGEHNGEIFGLKVLPDTEVRAHRTHHAKSPRGFWDGTAAEFREFFDKL